MWRRRGLASQRPTRYAPRVKTAHRKRDSSAVGLVFVGVLAGVLLLGGCSRRATPSAVVTDASIHSRSAEAVVIEFVIETTNPNDIELPMRDVVYTLSLDGDRVFSGRRDGQATMPRGGTQQLTIPVVVPMDVGDVGGVGGEGGEGGVVPGVYRYTLRGRVYYSLPSQLADVLFDAKLSRPSVMISDEGEIDLR